MAETIKPVALLSKDYNRILAWAGLNLRVKHINYMKAIIYTDTKSFFIVTNHDMLMSTYISGFIIIDNTVDADMLHWAFTQCR